MRYIGAISDTDILINFAKVKRLDILGCLFEKIIIPQYIYDIELKRKAGKCYSYITQIVCDVDSIFQVMDRKTDLALNLLSKEIIEEKKKLIGPGESECAGYAAALRIPIIISDNHTEFKWLDEFITLTHQDILCLCVHFGEIAEMDGDNLFNMINNQLSRPTQRTFQDFYKKSMREFKDKGWDTYLRLGL